MSARRAASCGSRTRTETCTRDRKPEVIVPDIPSGGFLRGGGHWTRDVAFSNDGRRMFVSVGSHSNDAESGMSREERRADILEYRPDGTGFRVFASGIRNAVGIAVQPGTGELWASVNERDELGDDLVPDYVTRVKDGGFYGWPWFYIGATQDPRHPGAHPELKGKVIVPDVLIQSHSASLEMVFYTGKQFPKEFAGDAFAAEHGSWNRGEENGLQGHPRAARKRSPDRGVRGLPDRIRDAVRRRLGTTRRSRGRARRRALRQRRRRGRRLEGELRTGGEIGRGLATCFPRL